MESIRRIAIVTHARTDAAQFKMYIVCALKRAWEAADIQVDVVRGPRRIPPADLVFPQVDLSVLPAAYRRAIDRYPRVVNRRVMDIRKSTFVEHGLCPDDAWRGRVIVKTDCNYGGLPERRDVSWWRRKLRRRSGRDLATTTRLDPYNYPIFESLDDVPREVFDNPALHVEKFLQEESSEGYVLRSYNFLGDRSFTRRRVSDEPIVRAHNSRLIGAPPVPPELLAFRERLGFDYGKIDFVVCDGKPVVLDINVTPTVVVGDRQDELERNLNELAEGIHACAPRA